MHAHSRNPAGPAAGHRLTIMRPSEQPGFRPIRHRWLRWGGYAALAVVLTVAFMGHTRPELMLNWENLMALCGFN